MAKIKKTIHTSPGEKTPPLKEMQTQQVVDVPKQMSSSKTKRIAKKQERSIEKQRNRYSQSVYTSRFIHFRILRISSWLIGTGVLVALSISLWKLYNTVFDTIENTEQLFFIQEVKKTDIIDFKTLENVRKGAAQKYEQVSTTTPAPLFGIPAEEPLDTEPQVVEE